MLDESTAFVYFCLLIRMFGFSTYRQRFQILFDIRWRFNFNYVHVFASSSLLFSLGLTVKPELLIESGTIRLNFFFSIWKKENRSLIADKNIENHSIGTVFFNACVLEKTFNREKKLEDIFCDFKDWSKNRWNRGRYIQLALLNWQNVSDAVLFQHSDFPG